MCESTTTTTTTYHISAHFKDLSSRRQSENTKRYTENTLCRRKIEMVNAPRCSSSRIRCIQRRSVRTCCGNFRGQNGKNTIDRADKKYNKRKNKQQRSEGLGAFRFFFKQDRVHREEILFSENQLHRKGLPLSNSLCCSVPQAVVTRCCCFSVGLTDSLRTAAC